MVPAACPNCSGYIHDPGYWVIGRPSLFISRRTKHIMVIGCCSFSGHSQLSYSTEEDACAAWENYRAKKAAKTPRLQAMLDRLNELDQRYKAGDTPPGA